MGRAIFPNANGIVRHHPDNMQLHHGCKTQGIAGLIGKGKEGAGIGQKAAMNGQAIHDCAHAEFPHAIKNIVSIVCFAVKRR